MTTKAEPTRLSLTPAVMCRAPFAVSADTATDAALDAFGPLQAAIARDMADRAEREGHIGIMPGERAYTKITQPQNITAARRSARMRAVWADRTQTHGKGT